MYLLCFLVPKDFLEQVKQAVFSTGAGQIGCYANCSWQTLGHGQFIPLNGSNAYIGDVGNLEIVEEYKVEIVCTDEQINNAVSALKKAHPYETPAYYVLKMKTDF